MAKCCRTGLFPRLEPRGFIGQKGSFDRQSPVIATQSPVLAQRAVAGDEPTDRVAAHGGAHRTHGAGAADTMSNVGIGGHMARRDV